MKIKKLYEINLKEEKHDRRYISETFKIIEKEINSIISK